MKIKVEYAIDMNGATSMITHIEHETYHQIFKTPSEAFEVVRTFLEQYEDADVLWTFDGFLDEPLFDKPTRVERVEDNIIYANFG
jgi:hypothetical protein